MKMYRGMEVWLHTFLTLALVAQWSALPETLPPGKEPPLYTGKEGGWAPEPIWMVAKRKNSLSAPIGNLTAVIQPTA